MWGLTFVLTIWTPHPSHISSHPATPSIKLNASNISYVYKTFQFTDNHVYYTLQLALARLVIEYGNFFGDPHYFLDRTISKISRKSSEELLGHLQGYHTDRLCTFCDPHWNIANLRSYNMWPDFEKINHFITHEINRTQHFTLLPWQYKCSF